MDEKREQEKQLNDMISLEDCVETTIYASNAPRKIIPSKLCDGGAE